MIGLLEESAIVLYFSSFRKLMKNLSVSRGLGVEARPLFFGSKGVPQKPEFLSSVTFLRSKTLRKCYVFTYRISTSLTTISGAFTDGRIFMDKVSGHCVQVIYDLLPKVQEISIVGGMNFGFATFSMWLKPSGLKEIK